METTSEEVPVTKIFKGLIDGISNSPGKRMAMLVVS